MSLTHDEFVKRIFAINPTIEVVGRYTVSTDRIKVKCRICGYEWEPKAYSLSQGKGCPHCSAIRGAKVNQGKTGCKDTETFVNQLETIDDSIEILSEYQNTHSNIKCKCKRCGHTWSAKPYSLLQGHGCPRCAKSGTSFMEQYILLSFCLALGEDKVLSRDKTAIGMELDIYIPSLHLAIEPGNWNLHKNSILRDSQKREKCAENGITLYTIYDVYPHEKQPPFATNCLVFDFDLNKEDHCYIKNLVYDLFKVAGINKRFKEQEFTYIENQAYSRAKSLTHEDFLRRMSVIHPNIQVMGTYQNANKRLHVKCNVCGYEWDAVPANLLAGDGCRKCGTKQAHKTFKKSTAQFISEIEKRNPDVEIIGQYEGIHKPILAKCRICGYEWSPNASSLMRGSSHKGASAMHKRLKNI